MRSTGLSSLPVLHIRSRSIRAWLFRTQFNPFIDYGQQYQRKQRGGDQPADYDRGQRPLCFRAHARGQQHRYRGRESATLAVISTGRNRSSVTLAHRFNAREWPLSRNSLMKLISTMPFSIATPKTATKPMADGTETYCPLTNRAKMPPMSRKRHIRDDQAPRTSIELKAVYSSRKINKIVSGTMRDKRASARC